MALSTTRFAIRQLTLRVAFTFVAPLMPQLRRRGLAPAIAGTLTITADTSETAAKSLTARKHCSILASSP
jgi:hypothetical protein